MLFRSNTMLSENSQTQIFNNNFRNIIINGDMSIAQRSTSVASITGGGYYSCDRWRFDINSQGTWTQSQSTDVPTGQGFAKSTKLDCTTADASPAAGDLLTFVQKVEGQNLQYLKKGTSSAESTTLSFWVKSNKTGTYIAELVDSDNSRQISKSYTISSANTWEKKTLTFAGDTTGAFANDNARSLDIILWLGAGSNYTSGTLSTSWSSITNANEAVGQVNLADNTANEWYVTGVQLEAGTTASEFEFLPHDVNFRRCLRYYLSYGGDNSYETYGFGMAYSGSEALVNIPFPVPMRSSPTVSTENLSSFYTRGGATAGGAPTGLVNDFSSTKVGNIALSGLSSMTDKSALRLYTNNSTATRLEFSAEL